MSCYLVSEFLVMVVISWCDQVIQRPYGITVTMVTKVLISEKPRKDGFR